MSSLDARGYRSGGVDEDSTAFLAVSGEQKACSHMYLPYGKASTKRSSQCSLRLGAQDSQSVGHTSMDPQTTAPTSRLGPVWRRLSYKQGNQRD